MPKTAATMSKFTKFKTKRLYNKTQRQIAKESYQKVKQKRIQQQKKTKLEKRLDPNTKAGRNAIVAQERLELKKAEIQAKKELAKKDPKFKEMELKNKLQIARIAEKGTADAAKATALGTTAAEMTKAIVNENDDDDEKARQQETINALIYSGKTATAVGDNSGLEEGVL